jgi:hypothetical protein
VAHVPADWPASSFMHCPVQQSASAVHVSPGWVQNDDGWHEPPAHSPEQHSPPPVHALPSVLHCGLRGEHIPDAQFWLQHCALVEHAWPSDVHIG